MHFYAPDCNKVEIEKSKKKTKKQKQKQNKQKGFEKSLIEID